MAVNESRSMNADLREGLTDGTVKKLAPNRGNLVDAVSAGTVYGLLHHELYDQAFSDSARDDAASRLTMLNG